jgi:type 1 glutamine amidotransferase
MEKLPNNLDIFSAVVSYIHYKRISDGALEVLDGFVSNGVEVLGVHTATASFKQQMHYLEIFGRRFTSHGPVENFEVSRVKNEIFGDIRGFVMKDELYVHELQPEIEAHYTAIYEDNDVPVVWTYQYGLERMCYAVPGHTTETMCNETYQKVLQCR